MLRFAARADASALRRGGVASLFIRLVAEPTVNRFVMTVSGGEWPPVSPSPERPTLVLVVDHLARSVFARESRVHRAERSVSCCRRDPSRAAGVVFGRTRVTSPLVCQREPLAVAETPGLNGTGNRCAAAFRQPIWFVDDGAPHKTPGSRRSRKLNSAHQ